jgi:hypothetical protein
MKSILAIRRRPISSDPERRCAIRLDPKQETSILSDPHAGTGRDPNPMDRG